MPKPSGLTKRPDSANWYYRRRWPKHLRQPGDPSDIWISLGTSEYAAAVMLVDEARAEATRRFTADRPINSSGIKTRFPSPRRPADTSLPLLTLATAASLARDYFRAAFRDMELNPTRASNFDPDRLQSYKEELSDRLAALRDPFADEEGDELGLWQEIHLLQKHGLRSDYASDASKLLREYLRRAMIELLRHEQARLNGNYSNPVSDELFAGTYSVAAEAKPPIVGRDARSTTVGEAAKAYLKEATASLTNNKTRNRYESEIAHIVQFLGSDASVRSVKRDDCRRLRDTFGQLQPNFAKRMAEAETFEQLIARQQPHSPTLKYATQEKYLDRLDRFLGWALKEDLVDQNYGADLSPIGARPDGSMAKLPFERDELERIFSRPIYTGCKNDEASFNRVGENIIRRSRYWAPLIGLFAGLRAGEILQLTPDHFRVSPLGNAFIVLTQDMKLKTENAAREIPVHTALKSIGLIDWVDRRRSKVDELLFPEVSPDGFGAASGTFSKRFRSDLKHFGLGARREKLTFHSFRHTFKRALDRASVAEHEMDELCGWARGRRTGRRYGTGLEADRLRGCIDNLDFQIDLSHLWAHAKLND